MRNFDYQFYQNLVEVLIPDVLRSIPSSLTQAIRNFAKSLESWLSSAMLGCPPEVVNIKVGKAAYVFEAKIKKKIYSLYGTVIKNMAF